MTPDTFRCYLVKKTSHDRVQADIERRPLFELPADGVLIRVAFSSLNYKDALAATGHPGVARKFPHVPGIDAAGTVVEDPSGAFRTGDEVLVTGYELGAENWGGWAEYIRVPAEWVVPLPDGLSLRAAMIYGTAGFTAALGVATLKDHGVTPDSGDILVTGATGGVGTLALKLLSQLGYSVVAVSGKTQKHRWLRDLGAVSVLCREDVNDASSKPLLPMRWAGAIDTVGGNTLATVLRATNIGGCVAACGLVGGTDLPLTVYPFILRGVTLAGIDSAWRPRDQRIEIWEKLAGPWKLDALDDLTTQIGLNQVDESVQKMLSGQSTGRVVIDPAGTAS